MLEQTHSHGSGGGWLEGDQVLSRVENRQAAIQVMVHIEPGFSIALALGTGGDLQAMVVQGDGVVAGHGAGVMDKK